MREAEAVLSQRGATMARVSLASIWRTEERERSGIFSTAVGLLSAYRSEAALAPAERPNFEPAGFAASSDTLYVCAPAHAQQLLAPIVVALLEQIRVACYERHRRHPDAAPVVFALDEVANIAPLAGLPALASEGASQGVVTLACLQDLSQARARWGPAAEGFFSVFSTKVLFPGVADQRTLELASVARRRGRGPDAFGEHTGPPAALAGAAARHGWPLGAHREPPDGDHVHSLPAATGPRRRSPGAARVRCCASMLRARPTAG